MQSIGIVGAGIMGSGIAQVCASAGLNVALYDINEEAARSAPKLIDLRLRQLVAKEKLTESDANAALARIAVASSFDILAASDLVIEAATENFDVKRKILQRVEQVVRSDALIGTNTSSLSITQLAAALNTPARLIGMHFFNPVPVMALVELIPGLQTANDALNTAQQFCARIGKTAIAVKNAPGFAVNRILAPMINEAIFVLQEGIADATAIDAGMKLGANHPIGPLALADMIGLDTLLAVMNVFYHDLNDQKYRPASLLKEMVGAGYLGRKTGRGFYRYPAAEGL